MPEISLLDMLKSGVHFGHQTKRWHPKMKPFIFTVRNGVHIIDLEKTLEKLKQALSFIEKLTQEGKNILFVGTKKQISGITKKYAKECQMPYVDRRWLGGTFTNFGAVQNLTKKYKDLKSKKETGELKKYTRKEQLKFDEEIEKLEKLVGGIAQMNKLPEAVLIFDVKKEKTCLREALKKNIPVIALVDTNVNPQGIDYVIPANDDAIKSIELMAKTVTKTINEAKSTAPKEENKKD